MSLNFNSHISNWTKENQSSLISNGYLVEDIDYICKLNNLNSFQILLAVLQEINEIKDNLNTLLSFLFEFQDVDLMNIPESLFYKYKTANPGRVYCETKEFIEFLGKSEVSKFSILEEIYKPNDPFISNKFYQLNIKDFDLTKDIDNNIWDVYIQTIIYSEKDNFGKNLIDSNLYVFSKQKIHLLEI